MSASVNDVLQVTYQWTAANQRFLTVLHYRIEVAPAPGSDEFAFYDAVATYLKTITNTPTNKIMAATPLNVVLTGVRVQKVKPVRTIYVQQNANTAGLWGASAGSVNVTSSIEKRSLHPGRTGLGRVQWPPVPSDVAIEGNLDADYFGIQLTEMANALSDAVVITGLYTATLRPCLPAGGADHTYDIWDALPQRTIRTMHRRTLGLGI